MPPVDLKSLVQEIVDRITVAADRIEIRLSRAKVAAALEAEGVSQRPDLDPVVLSTEAKLRRAGKGKRLVIENGAEAEAASPKSPSKSSRNAPHPTTRKRPRETLRPFAPRTQTFGVSGCRRCVRRVANARKF
jgi:hypothetical protein